MRLDRVEITPVRYAFERSFRSSHARLEERRGFRVELRDMSGATGCGEALPLPAAGTETLGRCGSALVEFAESHPGSPRSLDELLDELDARLEREPAARCAIDVAAHDLEGRLRSRAVASLLCPRPARRVSVNAVIDVSSLAETVACAAAASARGFETLKLKVGRDSAEDDQRRVAAVRAEVGLQVRLRVDANGAWSVELAEKSLETLARHRVELVEQPVRADDLDGLRRVSEKSPIPVAADEALASPRGRQALIAGRIADVAVLKPMVLGGLRASARLAAAAEARGIRCFVTTTFEGPIGTAAALHLAASLRSGAHGSELAHGLASSEVMAGPFPEALVPRDGSLPIPDLPGLGLAELR